VRNHLHNEAELIIRIADGDEAAFAVLFRHYYPMLRHAISNYTWSDADAEDVLNETFIRVWLSRDRLGDIDDLAAWITRIASRECIRIIMRNGRRQLRETKFAKDISEYEHSTPELLAQAGDINRFIQEAIDNMPDQRKRIYLLSRSEGLKPSEIAHQLDLSVNTVKNVLVSALKDIRSYLSSVGIEIKLMIIFLLIF
jgi:RNA polymerase sigma-70 factor (family 1)